MLCATIVKHPPRHVWRLADDAEFSCLNNRSCTQHGRQAPSRRRNHPLRLLRRGIEADGPEADAQQPTICGLSESAGAGVELNVVGNRQSQARTAWGQL